MAMSASLPGFLRRSAKANEKVIIPTDIPTDEKVRVHQNNPNNRAQWVDSVLQSIKTAAAAAAVPSTTIQNNGVHSSKFLEHALNKNSKTSPVVHTNGLVAVPIVTASNRIVESPTNLPKPHHAVNQYINDDVSEISDSPHFRTSQRIPIPSFSRMYQEMNPVQSQSQVVKIPLKKSILRSASLDNDNNAEQVYENRNGFPERVARYMQPLKRQQSNTVPVKEEKISQKGPAIRSPPHSKSEGTGKGAGIVLQPRHVEPTTRLHSTQQYIVTDSSSLSQKKDWIPNTIGNKVWSSRKVTRSTSPNRSASASYPHYAQPLVRSLSHDHNHSSTTTTTSPPVSLAQSHPSHSKILYASPAPPPPPPPPTSDLKSIPENMDYVKGLQAAFLSALREMLLAIPQQRVAGNDEQKPVQLHLCQFCSQKMHHCPQCSGGGDSNHHHHLAKESPIVKRGQFQETSLNSKRVKLASEIDREQLSNPTSYVENRGSGEMINPSQYIPESTRFLESPAMRTLHSETANFSPEIDSQPTETTANRQRQSHHSPEVKQRQSLERLHKGVSPESDSDFHDEIIALDHQQRGRRKSIQASVKMQPSSKAERERDVTANKRKVSAMKVFEAPRRLTSFSGERNVGNRISSTSNSGGMSSDDSIPLPGKITLQCEGNRRSSLKSNGDVARGKQLNEAPLTSAEKKKLLGMGKDSFAEFMDKKSNTSYKVDEEGEGVHMDSSTMHAGHGSQRKPVPLVNEPSPKVAVSLPGEENLSRQKEKLSNTDRQQQPDRLANDGPKINASGRDNEFFIFSHQSASSSGEAGMTDVAELQRLNGWLSSIGMSNYSNLLLTNGISKLSIVELLREGDLAKMGIQEDHINHILEKIGELSSRTRSFSEQVLHAKQHRSTYASGGQKLKVLTGRDTSALNIGVSTGKATKIDDSRSRLPLQQSPGGYSTHCSDVVVSEMNSPYGATARSSPTYLIQPGSTSPDRFLQSSHPIISSILSSIDDGVYKDFLTCWCSAAGMMPIHSSQLQLGRPALFDARLAIEFHLHVYFAIYPIINRLDDSKIYEGKLLLIRYLQFLGGSSDGSGSLLNYLTALSGAGLTTSTPSSSTAMSTVILVRPSKPTAFMRSREFATYASLAIVPDPERNLALQDLFKPEWRKALKKSLGEFLQVVGVDRDGTASSLPVVDSNGESETATDHLSISVAFPPDEVVPMAPLSPESLISRITNNKLKYCGEDCVSKLESFSASVDIIMDDGKNNNTSFAPCESNANTSIASAITLKPLPLPLVKTVLHSKKEPSSPLAAIYLEKVGASSNSVGSASPSLEPRKIGSLSPKLNALPSSDSPGSKPVGGGSISSSVGGSAGGFKLKKRAFSLSKVSSNTQDSSVPNAADSVSNGNGSSEFLPINNQTSIRSDAVTASKNDGAVVPFNGNKQSPHVSAVSELPAYTLASKVHSDGHPHNIVNQTTSEIHGTNISESSQVSRIQDPTSDNPYKIIHREGDDHSSISQLTDDTNTAVDNAVGKGITLTAASNASTKAVKPLVENPGSKKSDAGPTKIYQRLLDNNWSGIVKAPGGLPKKGGDVDGPQPTTAPESTVSEAVKRKPKATISKGKMQLQVSNYNKLLKQNGITLPMKEEVNSQPPQFPTAPEGAAHHISMQEQVNQQLQGYATAQQQAHLPPRPPGSKTLSFPSQSQQRQQDSASITSDVSKKDLTDNSKPDGRSDHSVSSSFNNPTIQARNPELLRANSLELSPDDTLLLNISNNTTTNNNNHNTRTVERDYKSDSEAITDRIFDSKLSPIHPRNDYHSDTETRGPPVSIADWKSYLQSSGSTRSSMILHNHNSEQSDSILVDHTTKTGVGVLPSTNHSKMGGAVSDLPGNGYSLPSNRFDKKIALVPPNTTTTSDDFAVHLPSKSFNKKLPSSQQGSTRPTAVSDTRPQQQQLLNHYMVAHGDRHGGYECNDAYLPSFSGEGDQYK
eukprot:gene27282-36025_t